MPRQMSVMGVNGTAGAAAWPGRGVPGPAACCCAGGSESPFPELAAASPPPPCDIAPERRGLLCAEWRASVADSVLSALRATSSFCSSSDTAGGGVPPGS